ncbi:DNA-binding storekeeper protein-related transcriptional regulator [Euphorbia peplus]|nr:DNA-binding storekeeper protein-related transcriptional regulator [Euphorbia peplus]
MAPKRATPIDIPPVSSSDEDETTSSGEEEDGESSSEGGQTKKTQKRASSPSQLTQTAKAVKKPNPAIKEVKSELETESDSESEEVPNSNVKAIASKQAKEETPAGKSVIPKFKTSASNAVLGNCSTKRGSEVERDSKDSKRSKTKGSESNGAFQKSEDTKKHLFQRLWSEDDEVTLLKGMIDFIQKKGVDPAKDMTAYYDFIKNSLHFDVALSQLKDKFWKMRKKFENHASKGGKGEDKTFSKPHDQKIFDLSKKLWGSGGICGRSKSSTPLKIDSSVVIEEGEKAEKGTEKENHVGSKETPMFDKCMGIGAMEDYVINRGLEVVEGPKKSEMEEKWRKLRVAELKLFLERNELISEQVKLMLAAYNSV